MIASCGFRDVAFCNSHFSFTQAAIEAFGMLCQKPETFSSTILHRKIFEIQMRKEPGGANWMPTPIHARLHGDSSQPAIMLKSLKAPKADEDNDHLLKPGKSRKRTYSGSLKPAGPWLHYGKDLPPDVVSGAHLHESQIVLTFQDRTIVICFRLPFRPREPGPDAVVRMRLMPGYCNASFTGYQTQIPRIFDDAITEPRTVKNTDHFVMAWNEWKEDMLDEHPEWHPVRQQYEVELKMWRKFIGDPFDEAKRFTAPDPMPFLTGQKPGVCENCKMKGRWWWRCGGICLICGLEKHPYPCCTRDLFWSPINGGTMHREEP